MDAFSVTYSTAAVNGEVAVPVNDARIEWFASPPYQFCVIA
jgi:hypothetical protein